MVMNILFPTVVIIVPAVPEHNVINTGEEPLLYTTSSPYIIKMESFKDREEVEANEEDL